MAIPEYTFGLKGLAWGAAFLPGGTAPTFTKIGKVYEDTGTMEETEPTKKEHREEGAPFPFLVTSKKGTKSIKVNIVLEDISTMVDFFGGTIATVGTGELAKKTWTEPTSQVTIKKAIKCFPDNGYATIFPTADIVATQKRDLKVDGLHVIQLTITPLCPSQMTEDVSDFPI